MNSDTCTLCEAEGPDMRTLNVDCFYLLTECVPEMEQVQRDGVGRVFYRIRICKSCRARFLFHLEEWGSVCRGWRGIPKGSDGNALGHAPDANIPVRVHGTTVMMTPEQYEGYRRNK